MSGAAGQSSFEYCSRMVRADDPARFAARLFARAATRDQLLALDAFRLETLRIAHLVREPMAGEVRLQWWRDVLAGGRQGEAIANPVAAAILEVISQYDLPRTAFERYVDALAFDLYHDPMPDSGSLEGWIGETESFLMQMTAIVCGQQAHAVLADACGHGGMATALARLLRLSGWYRGRGQMPFPPDMLAGLGTSADEWQSGASESLLPLIKGVAAAGLEHAAKSRVAIASLEGERACFLPLIEAEQTLKLAERHPGRALTGALEAGMVGVQLRYWKTALTGW